MEAEGLALTVRAEKFDEEKLLLLGALLGISSSSRTLQLKEIMLQFWEVDQWEMVEQHRLRRHRKREGDILQ